MIRLSRKMRILKFFTGNQSGIALLETLIALALLGIIGVTFLSGLATASKGNIIIDEQTTAESLMRSQMELAKKAAYVYDTSEYTPAPIPSSDDYTGYSATITAEPLNNPDQGIQKITVMVKHFDKELVQLQSYKVDR